MKPNHKIIRCQRCGKGFECKSGSISLCQCRTVVLSQAQRDFIATHYDSCLCASCLDALGNEFTATQYKGQG